MKFKVYVVTLTNGAFNYEYHKCGVCEREAIIQAQATAIGVGRGYKFVSIRIDTED